MFGLRTAVLVGAAMISVAIVVAGAMASVEEVCSRNYDKEQARFNREVLAGMPADELARLEWDAPIYDCEWRWRR